VPIIQQTAVFDGYGFDWDNEKSTKNLMIEILPFHPEDQEPVQALILAGLEEYWGHLDETKNPDLKNIAASYHKGIFLVAWLDNEIAGTGAFIPRSAESVEVVRMSVVKHLRRQGIGRKLLCELCSRAYQRGYRQVILETTATWQKAIAFYRAFGFQITHYLDGDVYFALDLQRFYEIKPSFRG
jgi:ribosomal protein S18 acetylase RimI-like enzyme